ncbi:hypothetical protein CHS0354_016491 [Potamilus streckersoni]|uniref:Uncharacterized protein n=1 Tax=Potamilus streckersoni TaxID=2493646 RepID=A0AAE0SJP9_9BIVA|nr:hypothetical protein CHS0354_016491 [Potamilus streckersoni]
MSGSNKGCWKCIEKNSLLELALYYNHLDIAENLITINACLSSISLCNAAKHGNFNRVMSIIESLKIEELLDPQNKYVKKSLCRAFISGNASLVELLLKEGIELDSSHVKCVVRHGDIDALMKLVEYLKHGNDWDPLHEKGNQANIGYCINDICLSCENELQFSRALYFAYRAEKLDMVEFLLKEGVKVTMDIFVAVLKDGPYTASANILQDLKDTNIWNPDSNCVSKAAEIAYRYHKCDLFELLIQKEVSFTMKNLPDVVSWGSNESITKVLQYLKHGFKWDPKSDYASQALKNALIKGMSDICILLVNEGVTLTMDIITDDRCWRTKETLKKVIEHLRELNKWNPKSDIALEALKRSYIRGENDISEQLLLERVTLRMSQLSAILHCGSKDSIIKAIHHLKDTGKWDVRVFYIDEISIFLVRKERYDVCDILIQEGVLIQMEELQHVVNCTSSNFIPKAIKHLKDTSKWYPKCDHASRALIKAYVAQKYDVCDLLIHEGVLLSMGDLSDIIQGSGKSVESVKRAISHLKDSKNWDPKFECMSTDLEKAYGFGKYNLCDLLIQEGVSLSMKNLPGVIASAESVSKAIQHLKNANNWDSDSCHAITALETTCEKHMFDVSNVLLCEGVSFTMKNILHVVLKKSTAPEEYLKETEFITQIIQHLKVNDAWDSSSEFVTQALENAFSLEKDAVVDILLKERISPTMKMLSGAVNRKSTEFVTKLVQIMKEANTWDPTSDLASDALKMAFMKQNHDVCNILIHEKVLLTMKILPGVVYCKSIEPLTKTIQLLKDSNLWDPSSVYAYVALKTVYEEIDADDKLICDITDLFFQEGVLLKMENLGICLGFYQSFTKVVHHLKEKGSWDPHSKSASYVLQLAYEYGMHDICDLLIQEGIFLLMENLLHIINKHWPSLKSVSKVIQHLKDKGNWYPQCESASVALQHAYENNKYDICDLLIQEGILPTMENLLHAIHRFSQSLQSVSKVVQHLKDKDNWDPQCEIASVVLQKAYMSRMYDVCDLLIQKGIPPRMENLPLVIDVHSQSLQPVSNVVQHLKDKDNWDPQCENASVALQKAYMRGMYDVCDLLIQEGIPPTMDNLLHVIYDLWPSRYSVSRVVQHLKDKGNWDPQCESASAALQKAYEKNEYDICDLLIQEGISLMMDNLLYILNVLNISWPSLQTVSNIIQHLKDTGNWNPHCESASVALQHVYLKGRFDVCDLLIHEGLMPTMEDLLHLVRDSWPSMKSVMKEGVSITIKSLLGYANE